VQAVGITEWGPPEVLHLVELPDPVPGEGEILIRVRAATVNPTDTQLRSGERAERLKDVPGPHVPGMEAAGTVEAFGPGVTSDLRAGDRVFAIVLPLGTHGAYAERTAVPAESVAAAPPSATFAEAATLPMNGLTARLALDVLELPRGAVLAVTGAAGGLGGYVVQLAKAAGLHVVADAAPADRSLVAALGADEIVDRGADMALRVRERHPNGVDAVVDAALLLDAVTPAVRDGGAVVTVRGYSGPDGRGVTWHPIFVRNYAREQAKLRSLSRLAEEGVLTMRVARTLPAVAAPEAHRLLDGGGIRGRIVLEF